jgi:signal peptidase I
VSDDFEHNPLADEQPEGLREFVASWTPAILAVIFIRLFIFEPFRIPSGSMVPTLLIGDHVLVTKFSYGVWMPFKSIGVPFTQYGLDDMGLEFENIELFDLADPQRGDVIVFHYPRDEDITYIKRVVGVPGDTIRVRDNQVFIDGVAQSRDELGPFEDVDQFCSTRKARHWNESLKRIDGSVLDHGILTQIGRGSPLASPSKEWKVPPGHVFVMGDNRDHSEDSRRWGLVDYEQIKGKAHFVWLSWDGCSGGAAGSLRLPRMFRSLYSTDYLDGAAAAE